jgi:hypothetical protein
MSDPDLLRQRAPEAGPLSEQGIYQNSTDG